MTPLWFWEFPPTQVLRPALVADEEQLFLPEKVEATFELQPWIVRDPDIVVQTREDANDRRRRAAQLPNEVWIEVDEYLRLHPDAEYTAIAGRLKSKPATKLLVQHFDRDQLARKIARQRPRK